MSESGDTMMQPGICGCTVHLQCKPVQADNVIRLAKRVQCTAQKTERAVAAGQDGADRQIRQARITALDRKAHECVCALRACLDSRRLTAPTATCTASPHGTMRVHL